MMRWLGVREAIARGGDRLRCGQASGADTRTSARLIANMSWFSLIGKGPDSNVDSRAIRQLTIKNRLSSSCIAHSSWSRRLIQ